tara:strand:+ start:154 stop:975 length:822 start_codon:yes stop_codon:yes gene_type:complete
MKKFHTIICQNCGNKGHHLKQCSEPKYSYGIIVYKEHEQKIEFLMICRRNTIGFVQFIRGQYINSDIDYIQTLFNVMTIKEIELIQKYNFEELWEYLWLDNYFKRNSDKIRKDKESSLKKFLDIKNGYMCKNRRIDIDHMITNKTSIYEFPEWEFPKGRRNINESNIETAKREFAEETGISLDNIEINTKKTYKEIYKSYDNIIYCNEYYLAKYITNKDEDLRIKTNVKEQFTEVSDIQFFTSSQAINSIRDYCKYKKNLILEVESNIISNHL